MIFYKYLAIKDLYLLLDFGMLLAKPYSAVGLYYSILENVARDLYDRKKRGQLFTMSIKTKLTIEIWR